MKKTSAPKKNLLVSVSKVRDLSANQLGEVIGGRAACSGSDPCPQTTVPHGG